MKSSIKITDGVLSPVGMDLDTIVGREFSALQIIPGFIDLHCHGAVGIDVNTADANGLLEIGRFLASRGVTAWLPTLVPDSDASYARVIAAIDEAMALQDGRPVAQIAGVHYEGAFANEKMCGALRPEYFKPASAGSRALPRLSAGAHMTTLAPEIDGGIELIEELTAEGWIVSIGHTRADPDTLERAYAAGARHMTHFFNAMTGIHHRDVGVAGWGLMKGGVTFDIIADGIHVDRRMVDFAVRAKTPDGVTLISDSVAPTGLGDGDFELWGERIKVVGGRTQNERGSIAGSVIAMDDAVRCMLSLGYSFDDISKMASLNPARILGLDDERGSIEPGKRADIVGLDADGRVVFTMIGGRVAGLS
jgi:N-acetylglucosamine-6-phosphate deacetylase